MLYSVDSMKYVTTLPHGKDYDNWRNHISDADYDKVVDAINQLVDANEINTAGWMPGNNWDGTVYEPLYYACGKNQTQAGMFFGLIVFKTLMEREDKVWGFGRYSDIKSMTYFVLDNPPPMK